MNTKVRNLIIILIILTLIVGGAIWWFLNKPKNDVVPIEVPQKVTTPVVDQNIINTQVQENLSEQIVGKTNEEVSDYSAILNTSRFFVERYGSFSTGAVWQNIYDVKGVVDSNLWINLEKLTQRKEATSELSLSTKVLSLNLESQNNSSAQVLAKTQKNEVKGTESRIFYQDITVDLIKQNDTWLVTDFTMGPEKNN